MRYRRWRRRERSSRALALAATCERGRGGAHGSCRAAAHGASSVQRAPAAAPDPRCTAPHTCTRAHAPQAQVQQRAQAGHPAATAGPLLQRGVGAQGPEHQAEGRVPPLPQPLGCGGLQGLLHCCFWGVAMAPPRQACAALFHAPLQPPPPCHLHATAYIMAAFASVLLVGMVRARAVAEAHEQFTLTPVLIGGRCGRGPGGGAGWARRGPVQMQPRFARPPRDPLPLPLVPRPTHPRSRLPALPVLAPLLLHSLCHAGERAQGQRQPHPAMVRLGTAGGQGCWATAGGAAPCRLPAALLLSARLLRCALSHTRPADARPAPTHPCNGTPSQVDPPPLLVHCHLHAHAVPARRLALGRALRADLSVVGSPAGRGDRDAEQVGTGTRTLGGRCSRCAVVAARRCSARR